MASPVPMPTKLKILTGNRGKRPLNNDEPEPENKIPDKPRILKGLAKTEWQRITKLLHELGLLTEIDRTALTVYCQNWQRWCEAEKELDKGLVSKTKTGYVMQNPYIAISNKAAENMKKFLIEFGMTPASRSRIRVPNNKKKESGFDQI